VVEEYIKPDQSKFGGSPSLEYFINDHGECRPTYACEQLLEADRKTFCGVYINPEVNQNKLIIKAFAAGTLFGQKLAGLGYRGFFDIDLVITAKNEVYAVESNLRRTGGTHTFEFALELLGKNFITKSYVASEDLNLKTNKELDYQQVKKILSDIQYDQQRKQGVIIYNPTMLKINHLSLFLVARSDTQLKKYRTLISKKFGL
jgi:hypothetical protein